MFLQNYSMLSFLPYSFFSPFSYNGFHTVLQEALETTLVSVYQVYVYPNRQSHKIYGL